jgi:hypothetical protein
MVMSSLPSASAFGIINSNVMQAMLGMLNRMVGAELKSLQKKDSNNKQDGVSMDIQLDEPAASTRPKGSRASQRLAASQEEEEESETDVDDTEEVDPFWDAPRGSRSQQSTATAAKTKLKPQQLLALLQDMRACVALFAQQPDEHTLNTAADLFVSLMYLCEIRAEYAGAAYMCRSVLVAFATTTRASLISTYRYVCVTFVLQTIGFWSHGLSSSCTCTDLLCPSSRSPTATRCFPMWLRSSAVATRPP